MRRLPDRRLIEVCSICWTPLFIIRRPLPRTTSSPRSSARSFMHGEGQNIIPLYCFFYFILQIMRASLCTGFSVQKDPKDRKSALELLVICQPTLASSLTIRRLPRWLLRLRWPRSTRSWSPTRASTLTWRCTSSTPAPLSPPSDAIRYLSLPRKPIF